MKTVEPFFDTSIGDVPAGIKPMSKRAQPTHSWAKGQRLSNGQSASYKGRLRGEVWAPDHVTDGETIGTQGSYRAVLQLIEWSAEIGGGFELRRGYYYKPPGGHWIWGQRPSSFAPVVEKFIVQHTPPQWLELPSDRLREFAAGRIRVKVPAAPTL
jgi:hypothetical protein